MFRLMLMVPLLYLCSFFNAAAQDYSSRGLMDIKEQSEAQRMAWIKAFDGAVQTSGFSALSSLRSANESYLNQQLSALRRLYAQGDGRALVTAVSNYLQIERQFVKDVMVPAESLTAGNQEGIDKIYQKITDFGQKEKIFLIEINNALVTEPANDVSVSPAAADPEMNMEYEQEEPRGSVVEGRRKARKKGKLPHEQMEEEQKRSSDEDD